MCPQHSNCDRDRHNKNTFLIVLNPNIQYTYCKQEKAYIYTGKTYIFRGGEGIYIDGKNPRILDEGNARTQMGKTTYIQIGKGHIKRTYIDGENAHI